VTRRTYALLGSLVSAGLTAWWWRRRHRTVSSFATERGTVIFDNTPQASTPDGNL
jgi:hypothetical protein